MANRKWSKHGFHSYMVCHALVWKDMDGGAIWGKTWGETLRKGELWQKMKDDCLWLAISVLNKPSTAFLQFGDMCFSSWDIFFQP